MVRPRQRAQNLAAVIAAASAASAAFAAPDYLGVVAPEAGAAPTVIGQVCAGCHGAVGVAIAPTFPNLAGQNYNYLLKQLEDFHAGARVASPMTSIVAQIPAKGQNQTFKLIARYFSDLKLIPAGTSSANTGPVQPGQTDLEAGYALYFQGNRATQVPACAACHSSSGLGNAPMAVPRLAGQNAPYIVAQLQAFAAGTRKNSPGGVMGTIAARLSDPEIKAIAAYLQQMRPELLPGSDLDSFDAYHKALASQSVPGIPAAAVAAPPDK